MKKNEKNVAIVTINANEAVKLFKASKPDAGVITIKRNTRFVRPCTMREHSAYSLFVNVKRALGKALKSGAVLHVESSCSLTAAEYGAFCTFASYNTLAVEPLTFDETGLIVTSIRTAAVGKSIELAVTLDK